MVAALRLAVGEGVEGLGLQSHPPAAGVVGVHDALPRVDGRTFVRGRRVVLRPEANRNAQDHLLDGRSATIERIYIDYDEQVHLCVTVDDDPGQDIMRDIGRYLYFKPTEVEVIGS